MTANGSKSKTSDIWAQDISWVKEADALIAEVANPSLGVGYEIAKAEEWGKPVLALYRLSEGKKLSAMIDGSPTTQTVYYDSAEKAFEAIDLFLED